LANENARALRKRLTPQEVKLWVKLRELKTFGFHFRRQAPIGRYIDANLEGVMESILSALNPPPDWPSASHPPHKGRAIAYDPEMPMARESDDERNGIEDRTSRLLSFEFSEFFAICDCPAHKGEG
jgi:hypothetical protein